MTRTASRSRRVRLAALGVAAVALLTACNDAPAAPAAAPSAAPTAVASARPYTPPPPCTLTLSRQRTVMLESEQAQQLTDALAHATRDGLGARATERAVEAALPELAGDGPAVVRALTRAAGLTCTAQRDYGVRDEQLTANGLTPRGVRLQRAIRAAFGALPMGGFAAGGVSSGHVDNSAHYEGRAIDVFLTPRSAEQTRRGWVLAHWLVAHAEPLSLLSVIWSDHIWTVWAGSMGWRDYVHPSGNTTNPVLRHLDHVHTAVVGAPRQRPVAPAPVPSPAG
ncbi:hypothetical protein [Motilibacter deserti]|uniref:ARB-07466-like C-terminal domain-containing protein n=1 Tax=Motilibacter deserti TaxID=2714956 RepID=A0ABX0GSU5_9ACTN|nr:hypothetical protein [Motilibacter deserti]NHC13176.1 hypothetical protein [Motilibacter deserti]